MHLRETLTAVPGGPAAAKARMTWRRRSRSVADRGRCRPSGRNGGQVPARVGMAMGRRPADAGGGGTVGTWREL